MININKYAIIKFANYKRVKDKILIKYENIEPDMECFKGVTVISTIPEKLEIVEISGDKFRWQSEGAINFYGLWQDIPSDNIPIFEAVDDDIAKLIFEVGD